MRELDELKIDAVCGGRNSVRISHVSQKNRAVVVKSALIDVDQRNDIHIDINQDSSPQRYPAPAPV